MIDFPIVDSHLHVWDPERIDYPWLDGVPHLNRRFLIEDYQTACGDVAVEKMIFVQAEADFAQSGKEVEWVTSVAKEDPRISAIVGWAPLENGDAAVQELEDLATNPLVKGIRRIIQFESDAEFCLRPDFVRGVQHLPTFGLSFDICVNHHQLASTIKMVAQCPDVSFVLDHIGKPDIARQAFEPWKGELRALSEFSNVSCKISGLVTEANLQSWTREDLRPYIDHVLDCFGFSRTMYGGDWPVATQATIYSRWVETLHWAVAGCSVSELRSLFHDNAVWFYRLSK
jgi:L-fuconolactonase